MLTYWLLFAFPAILTLGYPVARTRLRPSSGQLLALFAFGLGYTLIGGLRYEVGGDWIIYDQIFEELRLGDLANAMGATDPLYGLSNWVSAQLGLGIYLVNAICCLALVYGVLRAALTLREPWLAIVMAVPYLLIVVGLGYVRQGAAIGMMLAALASLDRARPMRTIIFLGLAIGFHSTAVVALPVFMASVFQRHKVMAVIFAILFALAFLVFFAPKIDQFQAGYIDAEYNSGGATARILMNLVPSLLLLARQKHFPAESRVRLVWIAIAWANVAALVALLASPSSTAVDRLALYFSVIQLGVYGEMRSLVPTKPQIASFVRVVLIGVAALVQIVWLVFGTYASFWVPYKWVFGAN